MKQKIVGIVPFSEKFDTEYLYEDKYHFANTYGLRATEVGLSPIGVLPVNRKIVGQVLEMCDCFIIIGGKNISPHQIQVVEHAVKTGKKLLGVCLGCQSIQVYFGAAADAEKAGWTGDISDYLEMRKKEEAHPYLGEVSGHRWVTNLERFNVDAAKHKVLIREGTHVHNIVGATEIMGVSLHNFCVAEPAPGLTVSAWAEDGTIEAIEHGDNIIGTQFHPDADRELLQFFEFLL